MARPHKLTPELQAEVLKGLATGASRRDVAEWVGIGHRTIQRWLKQGEDVEADDSLREFWRSVHRTERWVKLRLLGIIQQASADDPHLALKFLERKWPEEFGRRSVRVEGQHEVKATVKAPPKLAQLLEDPACRGFMDAVLSSDTNGNGSNGNGSAARSSPLPPSD